MSFQLIFTSAPRGLTLGRSGFCTVARHREINDSLVSALERCSAFERPEESPGALPIIHAYRILRLGAATYHVLSRIQDAGVDYTQRGNHLAHHLIFLPGELQEDTSPADVFLKWNGWINNWNEGPRFLEAADQPVLSSVQQKISLPAQTWRGLTGDAARAALLAGPGFRSGVIVTANALPPRQSLQLFGESLLLLSPDETGVPASWSIPFTTHLQNHDTEEDFSWIVVESPEPSAVQSRRGLPVLPLKNSAWPLVTDPALAQRAREGGSAVAVLKATTRLPDLSSVQVDPDLVLETFRPPVSPRPFARPDRSAGPQSPLMFVVLAAIILLVLGGGWFLTRSSAPSPLPSVSAQIADLKLPGKREALRQFLRENPATTGDPGTDSSLNKAALWLEASDYLEQLQFLRRQEQIAPLRDAVLRVQNLPQLADLKNNLPPLGYELNEAENWLARRATAPTPAPNPSPGTEPLPAPAAPPQLTGLDHYFGTAPVMLAILSPEKSVTFSATPEVSSWTEATDPNPARAVRVLPLDHLPLAGEGVTAKTQIRRNRSDPFRFYQGVHLLFELKPLDGNDGRPAFELALSKDIETAAPPGPFGRVLQFMDANGIVFSIFILKQGLTEPVLHLPRSMIDFDPGTPSLRLRKELYRDAKITLMEPATAVLGAPTDLKTVSSVPLNDNSSWEKLQTSGSETAPPALALDLLFPDGEQDSKPVFLLLFEGEASP